MHGEQSLIGSHNMFAIANRLQHESAGRFITTDQLDDDLDFRII